MIRFSKYEKRGYPTPKFDFDDKLDEMEFALEEFEQNLKFERDIKFYRILIIGICWIGEKVIKRTGHDLGLEGWWKHVQKNIAEFDEYLEEMVKDGTNWPSEIRLTGALAMSALTYSAANNLSNLANIMSTSAGEFFMSMQNMQNGEANAAPQEDVQTDEIQGPKGVDILLGEIERDEKRASRMSEKAKKHSRH